MENLNIDDITSFSDDKLAEEVMYWTRVYRAEENLFGKEREYYKAIILEYNKRKNI